MTQPPTPVPATAPGTARRRFAGRGGAGPVAAAVGAGIMVLLVAAAAGLAGSLSSTGPRWLPDLDGDSRSVADPTPTPTDAYVLPLLPEMDGGEPARNLLPVLLAVLTVVVVLVGWYVWRRWSTTRITLPAAQPGASVAGTVMAGVDVVPAAATTAVHASTVRHGLERALDELDAVAHRVEGPRVP
ncbi:MAG: hypothetical protein ACTMIR_14695, partial [Cellulomonadaceae bacterium]